jgi:hypothetical protein
MARIAAFSSIYLPREAEPGRCRSSVVEHSLGKGMRLSKINALAEYFRG